MRIRSSVVMVSVALAASVLLSMDDRILAQQGVPPAPRARGPVPAGEMGDYVVVPNWPKPLPDKDLSHDGWTWGSGSGVFAESPDKVWVSQRGEISLPPGAEPWICPCLLNPRRTNTGRRPYAGTPYPYEMRRHHIVFISGVDALHEQRFGRIAFDDGRLTVTARCKSERLAIQSERILFGLPGGGVRSVTVIAVFGKNRLDVPVERNRLLCG